MSQENLLGNQQENNINNYAEQVDDLQKEQEQTSTTPLLDSIISPAEQSDTLRAARSLLLVLGDAAAETKIVASYRRDMSPELLNDTMRHVTASVEMTLTDARSYASLPGEYICDGTEVQAADLVKELIASQREAVMPRVAESLKRDIVDKRAEVDRLEQEYQKVLLSITPDVVLERHYDAVDDAVREVAAELRQQPADDLSVAKEAESALADKDTRISTGRLVKILGSTVMSFLTGHNEKPRTDQSLSGARQQPFGIMNIINRS